MEGTSNSYYKHNTYNRWGFNKYAFNQLNIHGRNTMKKEERRQVINSRFSACDTWTDTTTDEIINLC